MDRIIREVIEIELHPNIINREVGFSLSRWRKPLICDLREWKQVLNENMMPSDGPLKWAISSRSSLPTHLLSLTCLKVSQDPFPYSSLWSAPFPSTFVPQTIYISPPVPSLVTSGLKLEIACFSQPLFLKFYISPLIPSLVTSAPKMETSCFSEPLFLRFYISPYFPALLLQPYRWRQHVSLKCWLRPMKPHGAQTRDEQQVSVCSLKVILEGKSHSLLVPCK
jgi:hypothetical protein